MLMLIFGKGIIRLFHARVSNVCMQSRDVIARLEKEGWILVNVRGSHQQFKHPDIKGRVTVPHPKKDLPLGTLKSIYKQASWVWP